MVVARGGKMNKKGNRTEALKDLVIYGGLHYQQRFINVLTRFAKVLTRFTKMRGVGKILRK